MKIIFLLLVTSCVFTTFETPQKIKRVGVCDSDGMCRILLENGMQCKLSMPVEGDVIKRAWNCFEDR